MHTTIFLFWLPHDLDFDDGAISHVTFLSSTALSPVNIVLFFFFEECQNKSRKCYIFLKEFNTFKALNTRFEVHDALVKPMCAWSFT